MTKARFLWRVAFLCNVCYCFSIYLRMHPSDNYGSFQSTILIMGTLLGFLINMISVGLFVISRVRRKGWEEGLRWLPLVNAVFFIVQILDLVL